VEPPAVAVDGPEAEVDELGGVFGSAAEGGEDVAWDVSVGEV